MRLLPEVTDYDVIGTDLNPPQTDLRVRFLRMDLGDEDSCRELMLLLRDVHRLPRLSISHSSWTRA